MVKVHDVGVRTLILLQVLSTLGSDQPEAPEDIISFEGGNDIIECTTLPSRKDERKKNKTETAKTEVGRILVSGKDDPGNSIPSNARGQTTKPFWNKELVDNHRGHARRTRRERQKIANGYLNDIHSFSTGSSTFCNATTPPQKFFPDLSISTESYRLIKEKVDLVAFFMPRMSQKNNEAEVDAQIEKLLYSLGNEPQSENLRYVTPLTKPSSNKVFTKDHTNKIRKSNWSTAQLEETPWYFQLDPPDTGRFDMDFNVDDMEDLNRGSNIKLTGYWTWPYFKCLDTEPESKTDPITQGKWLISYSVAFRTDKQFGLLSFDVDLTHFPIKQCDSEDEDIGKKEQEPMDVFHGTHKCNVATSNCVHKENQDVVGWFKGNYECTCKNSHHAFYKSWNNSIPGIMLENKWCVGSGPPIEVKGNETQQNFYSFRTISSCHRCPTGCPDCIEAKSCMAEANYVFRVTIFTISILCGLGSLGLIGGVFQCRKHQIFATSSPIFLCITLFGCGVMYSEMVVLFPELSHQSCVAVKWTRHLGFCITYTALYMKLCRVYLTYRVKSAHKIKLTEKHLLHWMSPIMVIMLLYLSAWTISDPPVPEIKKTHDGQRLYQCVYNWWDHVLSAGEIIFLAYGVFICWRIREHHDAQFISYSIYNITIVNVTMVTFHLMVLSDAGPDLKYLLAFLRVQLSTTITIALVLGSKVYRAYKHDYPTMREVANSANGFGREVLDLDEENLQLKEELQKLATQMERLKSYALCKNNPHLNTTVQIPTPEMEFGRKENATSL